MNSKLKDPISAAGASFAIIGGVMMFALLFNVPDAISITGVILWALGIGILVIHTAVLKKIKKKKKKQIDIPMK